MGQHSTPPRHIGRQHHNDSPTVYDEDRLRPREMVSEFDQLKGHGVVDVRRSRRAPSNGLPRSTEIAAVRRRR
jgi:hypothetical protein